LGVSADNLRTTDSDCCLRREGGREEAIEATGSTGRGRATVGIGWKAEGSGEESESVPVVEGNRGRKGERGSCERQYASVGKDGIEAEGCSAEGATAGGDVGEAQAAMAVLLVGSGLRSEVTRDTKLREYTGGSEELPVAARSGEGVGVEEVEAAGEGEGVGVGVGAEIVVGAAAAVPAVAAAVREVEEVMVVKAEA
jgi:hypothetical protein